MLLIAASAEPYIAGAGVDTACLQCEAGKFQEISGPNTFEFPELMDFSKELQERLVVENKQMLQLWHFVDLIDSSISEWKTTLWNDINCEEIEDGAKLHFKNLRALDKYVKQTNTYNTLEKYQ